MGDVTEKVVKKILVVDDDEDVVDVISMSLRHMMSERFDIEAYQAYNGMEAIEKMASEKFDLVFMDYIMPKINGGDVIQAIRKGQSPNKLTPFVLLSGNLGALDADINGPEFEDVYMMDKNFDDKKLSRIVGMWLLGSKK